MKRTFVFLCLSILFCAFPLASQSMAAPKEKKPPVVLMPLYGGPGIATEHFGAYESAVKKALSEKYTVYSGDRVMEKLKKIFQKRSAGEKGSLECDETKCYQDVAIAFQSELIAAARITKSESGYLLSINIVNVGEDAVVFTNSATCRGCDELEVVESLYLLAGGAPATPARGADTVGAVSTAPGATKVAPTKPGVKENAKYKDNGDGTVTAKVAGLMWQKQDDGEKRNWDDAIAYCKGLGLAGYSDWRLPSKEDLKSIIESGREDPAIDTEYFTDTQSWRYWSSTTHAGYSRLAWRVNFSYGLGDYDGKSDIFYVRCVRLGQTDTGATKVAPTKPGVRENAKYKDNEDGTVTAKVTGLMWQKQTNKSIRDWENAIAYCKGLRLAGYVDWRLPSIEELKTLIEGTSTPIINTEYFPDTQSSNYWSSTTYANGTIGAWCVNFTVGNVYGSNKADIYHFVRCVRFEH